MRFLLALTLLAFVSVAQAQIITPPCPNGVCPLQAPKLAPGATIPQPMPQRPVLVAETPEARRGPLRTIRNNIAERRQGRAYARCTK